MKRISAEKLVELGTDLREAQVCLDANNGIKEIDPSDRAGDFTLYEVLTNMRDLCRLIDAKQIGDLVASRCEYTKDVEWENLRPKTWEDLDTLANAFARELEERMFFYLPADSAPYYQSNDMLSAGAKVAFPNLAQEVRNAATAYAVGMPTASVFHCMRALEHSLAALARDVGLTWTKEQWHTIIEQIEKAIGNERQTLARGTAKDERLRFLSEIATEFYYFKDGWRNYVAHNKVNYDAQQALEVLVHVRAFAEKLSQHLTE